MYPSCTTASIPYIKPSLAVCSLSTNDSSSTRKKMNRSGRSAQRRSSRPPPPRDYYNQGYGYEEDDWDNGGWGYDDYDSWSYKLDIRKCHLWRGRGGHEIQNIVRRFHGVGKRCGYSIFSCPSPFLKLVRCGGGRLCRICLENGGRSQKHHTLGANRALPSKAGLYFYKTLALASFTQKAIIYGEARWLLYATMEI